MLLLFHFRSLHLFRFTGSVHIARMSASHVQSAASPCDNTFRTTYCPGTTNVLFRFLHVVPRIAGPQH